MSLSPIIVDRIEKTFFKNRENMILLEIIQQWQRVTKWQSNTKEKSKINGHLMLGKLFCLHFQVKLDTN